ncbi:hypothetical protein LSUE1_G004888 [Lachnellula suecica]|uniref:Transmembrane protein n=1 Tax=Lachnellula suecica TaxID=602035 RepID=A0A8T9CCK0_9HELO|nr:hypothetical protein LSUE1_G004888 [Lachnellula suecica]
MLQVLLLVQLSLAGVFAVTQKCVWKSGELADGYAPCTNSSAKSGACCNNGEACLAEGLCISPDGLVYRGACINSWDADCPGFGICEDISENWANIYPCAIDNLGSQPPINWWCGATNTTACTQGEGHFLPVPSDHYWPGAVVKIANTTAASSAASTTAPTASESTSILPSTGSSNQAETTSCTAPSSKTNNGVTIGLGVIIGVLALTCVVGGIWAFLLFRHLKAQLAALSNQIPTHGRCTRITGKR